MDYIYQTACFITKSIHMLVRFPMFFVIPLFLFNCTSPTQEKSPPNVIFIITDDQHYDTFGFLEGKALTPNIDRFAVEGLYFSRAYVASSVCTPSRFTCMSGRYASNCTSKRFISDYSEEGVPKIAWNLGLERELPKLSSVLQAGGYRTGFIGKWHVGGVSDHFQRVPEGSDPADPAVDAILKANQEGYCKRIRERYGYDFAQAVYNGNPDDDKSLVNSGTNVHNMEWLTQAAFDFLESDREEPFYLYFSPTLLHSPSPLASLKEDPRKSGAGLLDFPIEGVLPSRESVIQRTLSAGFPEKAAGATWLDDVIGALMEKLELLGLAENTLVVYFNDNGMETHAKGSCYEGGINIPVMFRWPGEIEPGTNSDFISNIDFVPTLLDICGVEKPQEMRLDGRSLVPLLYGETPEDWRESVYSEIGYTRSVTTEEWKYIAFKVPESVNRTREERVKEYTPYYEDQIKKNPLLKERYPFNPEAPYYQIGVQAGGYVWEWYRLDPDAPWLDNYFDSDQLYHLAADPLESKNLAGDPTYADKLAEMKDLLREHLKAVPGNFADLLD